MDGEFLKNEMNFLEVIVIDLTQSIKIHSDFLYIDINGFDLHIVFLYVNKFVVFLLAAVMGLLSPNQPIKRITLMKPITAIK